MKLKIGSTIAFVVAIIALSISINVSAHKISNPSFVHDIICKPQNLLHFTFVLPALQPDYNFNCYLSFANEFSNHLFCLKTKADSCYQALAIYKLNPNYCKNIILDTDKYNNCVHEVITYTKNPAYCNLIRELKGDWISIKKKCTDVYSGKSK